MIKCITIIDIIYLFCKDKKKTKDNGQQTTVFFDYKL